MIVAIKNNPNGDHIHVCDGCEAESTVEECIDIASECYDEKCAECRHRNIQEVQQSVPVSEYTYIDSTKYLTISEAG